MDKLKPLVVDGDVEMLVPVVIGTVKGDLHNIGKNQVGIMIEGAEMQVLI